MRDSKTALGIIIIIISISYFAGCGSDLTPLFQEPAGDPDMMDNQGPDLGSGDIDNQEDLNGEAEGSEKDRTPDGDSNREQDQEQEAVPGEEEPDLFENNEADADADPIDISEIENEGSDETGESGDTFDIEIFESETETPEAETGPGRLITVDPLHHDFGSVDLGSPPVSFSFRITDTGDPDAQKLLTISQIAFTDGSSPHYSLLTGGATPEKPVVLAAGQIHDFTVQFNPQWKSDPSVPFEETVRILNDSDDPSQRMLSATVSGSAVSATLSVVPTPIDFGELLMLNPGVSCTRSYQSSCPANEVCCPQGEFCASSGECVKQLDIKLYNWSSQPRKIKGLTLVKRTGIAGQPDDTDCGDFTLEDYLPIAGKSCQSDGDCPSQMVCSKTATPSDPSPVCMIKPGDAFAQPFIMRYHPSVPEKDTCHLRIESDLPGVQYLYVPVLGQGRQNKCPTAQISRRSHGEPVVHAINGIGVGIELCLYGDGSSDPDGKPAAFEWSVPVKPIGGAAAIRYLDPDHANACFTFDRPGQYQINLRVKDNEDCWSAPAAVDVNATARSVKLRIVLDYNGGGNPYLGKNLVEMDLRYCDPNTSCCTVEKQPVLTECTLSTGCGVATLAAAGSRKEIYLSEFCDGSAAVTVSYVEDCNVWIDFLVVPFCASTVEPNPFTLNFYDPTSDQPDSPIFPTLSGSLKKGESKTWKVAKVNGNWQLQ